METARPTALRATASSRTTLFGRRKRVIRYDARFADGHVEQNVKADDVLDGQHLPADASATRHAAEAVCPEVGTGPWVEYATGRLLD
ncbi:hypothetical protein [Nostocoides sp. Soil756]|jgi:hypothetical protein|uniref:hypothetical protein n=1 Tax=Nostocoides sp. Soil756 TaxID=1736399 RepID=UPI000B2BC9A7|nr:hypothetical protein [Tetrasphaera sp. Soil756]